MNNRILIVEDEKLIAWSIQKTLKRNGYDVVSVETADKALLEINKASFDLIITDFRIEPINGLELTSKIKLLIPTTEVIIITTYDTEVGKEKAFAAGASAYIKKPFSQEEILDAIQNLLPSESKKKVLAG